VPERHLIDNLKHGADVVSFDGEKVGTLHAVVVDSRDEEVTQVVVNSGPHFPAPGFGAPDLVTVPIAELEGASEKEVLLRCTREQFNELPSYVERSFFAVPRNAAEGEEGSQNVLMNVGTAIANSFAALGGIPVPAEVFRKAEFERHILNDAPIWRQEPFEQLGEVERVLVNNETDEIEALVVRRGHFFPHEVVLPIGYVTEVRDGIVQVELSDVEVRDLKPFAPEA
jgi:sporulation protein YlmC with PRC-barrel domain